MDAAIDCTAPKLATLAKQHGDTLEVVLKLNIAALDKALKNKDGLTPDEIELIADEVLTKWGYLLTFADIAVIFRNAKLGRYGETYQQLTAAKVVRWFDEYADERMNRAYEMNRERDRMAYEATEPSDGNLHALGYKFDADGRVSIDVDVVSANNEKAAQRERKRAAARQEVVDMDNEYMKWREKYDQTGQL